jgi:beta-galactosidase GanA
MAMGWGGLRIVAGNESRADPAQFNRRTMPGSLFVYGSLLDRPPNPPATVRRQMLKDIAQKYRFNTVRIYPSWAYQNPQPDRFDFSDTEEVMRLCDQLGLRVLMGVVLEDAPFWLEAAHPEARYVNAEDHPVRLGNNGDDVTAGWPGLCLDWSPVRQAAASYLQAMAKVVSAHTSFYAYDCWNEPHIEAAEHHMVDQSIGMDAAYCYCSRTIAAYQRWLQKRYLTLEALSTAWVRRYADWSEIDPPRRKGPYMDWVDWRRFMIERETGEMRFRIEQVRAVNTHGVLESHLGLQVAVDSPIAILGVNPWEMAKALDVWGISYFPRWGDISSVPHAMARFELTRSQAGSKPFWVTELQGGYSVRAMRPRDIRCWNWMAIAAGAKGILYWTYHPDIVGPQANDLGLVGLGGEETERVVEATQDCRLIQQHWDILENYRPRSEVALLFDQDSALLTFAMTGNEQISAQSYRGYYRALWNCDLGADFIEPESISNPAYKVLIVPWLRMLKRETAEDLTRFVTNGGTVILESGFGTHDEHAFRNFVTPPYGLAQAFGYTEQHSLELTEERETLKEAIAPMPQSERIYVEGYLDLTEPVKVRVRAHSCLTPITVDGATVIASYGHMPVAARKDLGRGRMYYIGTNLGASIEAGDSGALQLLRAIFAESVQPKVTADQLRPRLIEGIRRSLLIVCNEGAVDVQEVLKIPARYHSATDLHCGESQNAHNNSITVTVPFESALVLLLE